MNVPGPALPAGLHSLPSDRGKLLSSHVNLWFQETCCRAVSMWELGSTQGNGVRERKRKLLRQERIIGAWLKKHKRRQRVPILKLPSSTPPTWPQDGHSSPIFSTNSNQHALLNPSSRSFLRRSPCGRHLGRSCVCGKSMRFALPRLNDC